MAVDNAYIESELPSIQQPPLTTSSPLSSCTLKEQTKQQTRIPTLRRSQSLRLRTSSFSSTSSVIDYPALRTSDFIERYHNQELNNNLNGFDFIADTTADPLSNHKESPTGASTQSLTNHVGAEDAVVANNKRASTKTKQHGMVRLAFIF